MDLCVSYKGASALISTMTLCIRSSQYIFVINVNTLKSASLKLLPESSLDLHFGTLQDDFYRSKPSPSEYGGHHQYLHSQNRN